MLNTNCLQRVGVFILLIVCGHLVLLEPSRLAAENVVDGRFIDSAGTEIASIFAGLKPSEYVLQYRKGSIHEKWLRREELYLGDRLDVHLIRVQCQSCQSDTVCADHYQRIVQSTGCTDPHGACPPPLHNAVTDTQNSTYSQGAYDSYCGIYCCADAQECANP